MYSSFIKVTSFYKEFLNSYYQANPNIVGKSFSEQYKHLMSQGYGYSNYFPLYLEKNYAINGFELIHNAKPLQSAWAKENECQLSGDELLLEQIKTYKPEILFIQDSINFDRAFILKIKEEVTSVKLLIGHCCAPYTTNNLKAFQKYDVILTCSEKFVNELQDQNIKSYLFPHAFEASLLNEIQNNGSPTNDIIFIGSLYYRSEFHKKRISYVEEILQSNLPLIIYGILEEDTWHVLKLKQSTYLVVKLLEKLNFSKIHHNQHLKKIAQLKEMPTKTTYSSVIKKSIRNELLFGKKMLQEIVNHTIGFNLHGEVAGDYAANVRMFEVAGAGTLLVTDHKKNIKALYEPDMEILTYKSKEECIEKLKWAHEHPAEAREIAIAGQKRTLSQHSVEKRVDLLYEIIRKEFSNRK